MSLLVLGDVPGEQLHEVVCPVGEQPPVLARCTKQRGDDRHRVGPRDVGDHLTAPDRGKPVDQLRDDVDDDAVEPGDRARGERLGHEPAQPGVVVPVHGKQRRARAVPQRSRRDALRLEAEPSRHLESGVAQRPAHQLVAQNLGAVRPHRDRALLEGLAQVPVCLVGSRRFLVLHSRQVGFEHTGGSHENHASTV